MITENLHQSCQYRRTELLCLLHATDDITVPNKEAFDSLSLPAHVATITMSMTFEDILFVITQEDETLSFSMPLEVS